MIVEQKTTSQEGKNSSSNDQEKINSQEGKNSTAAPIADRGSAGGALEIWKLQSKQRVRMMEDPSVR